jgi:4-amino-4-deoxy-L-arabinose transferase-like glycosyltransferase
VLPAHVINSHYATVDVPATFLVSLMAVILLRLFGRADFASYLLAGLALGLATATKYAMVIAVAPLLLAHVFARDDQDYAPSVLYLVAALGAACLAFFAVTPYLLLMGREGFRLNPDVVRDVTFEMQHMRAGGTFAFANTGLGWIYHLVHSLPAGMGYPALALGLAGGALIAWRGGPVGLVLLAFALPYFGVIGASKERFLRYTLPLLPALAIAAAYALDQLREASIAGLGKRQAIIAPALLGAALFGVTLCYSGQTVLTMIGPDPRTSAAQWLQARATRHTLIGLASVPWYFTPPITPFNGGERSREQFVRWQRAHPPYRVIVIGWDAAELRRQRPDYFVVSDAEDADLVRLHRPDAAALMEALPRRYRHLKVFEPPPPAPWLRPGKLACPPDWLYTWPRIEVYY